MSNSTKSFQKMFSEKLQKACALKRETVALKVETTIF